MKTDITGVFLRPLNNANMFSNLFPRHLYGPWLFNYDKICFPITVNDYLEIFHQSNNQTHGSQPTQTLPSTFGSMAWSSRQSTWFSTDKPAAGSLARMLCSLVPKATDCIPGKALSFSKPSFSSSLTKQRVQYFGLKPVKDDILFYFETINPKLNKAQKSLWSRI